LFLFGGLVDNNWNVVFKFIVLAVNFGAYGFLLLVVGALALLDFCLVYFFVALLVFGVWEVLFVLYLP
jgi:hypothetical protein